MLPASIKAFQFQRVHDPPELGGRRRCVSLKCYVTTQVQSKENISLRIIFSLIFTEHLFSKICQNFHANCLSIWLNLVVMLSCIYYQILQMICYILQYKLLLNWDVELVIRKATLHQWPWLTYLSITFFPSLRVHRTCLDWYPTSRSQTLGCLAFAWWLWWWWWCLKVSVRIMTVLFSLEAKLKSTVVLPLIWRSLWWGNRQSLQAPALRLYWYSPSPAGQLTELEQVLISVRLGQFAPPYIGVARTCRVRCCRPAPQVLLQLDQDVKSETTQSWGQGMRQACSTRGFWEKNSHIREDTVVVFEVRTQRMLRLWMPCCAVMQPAVLRAGSFPKKGTRAQSPQSDTSHWNRSWCQSQTLKHCRWLSGLSMCWQWLWWVVQPSEWTHHIVLDWTPPEPHSCPIQWPHWPATKTGMIITNKFTDFLLKVWRFK